MIVSLVTGVCSNAPSITIPAMMVLMSLGQTASDQHDVDLPPPLILRDTIAGVVPHHYAAALTSVPDAFLG